MHQKFEDGDSLGLSWFGYNAATLGFVCADKHKFIKIEENKKDADMNIKSNVEYSRE